jgi:hypothetical protein
MPNSDIELLIMWPEIELEAPGSRVLRSEMPISVRYTIGIEERFVVGQAASATRCTDQTIDDDMGHVDAARP